MQIIGTQRLEVLMEQTQSDVKLVLEYVADIAKRQPKVDQMAKDMDQIKSDIAVLKVGYKKMGYNVQQIESDLKQKANKTEVIQLDQRVKKLELKTA